MRLTDVLGKQPIKWYLKNLWKTRGYVVENRTMMPDVLRAKGVKVVDAAEAYFPKKRYPDWVHPVPNDPRIYARTIEEHPDYKKTPIYEFNWRSRLIEGHKQALQLTKSQPFEGLPDAITQNIGAVQIPHRDKVVQRAIMQSNKWDPTIEKLPRRFNPKLPGWKYKAESGIPHKQRCRVLAASMLRIVRQCGGKYPDIAHSLRMVQFPYVSSYYYYNGDTHLTVRGVSGDYLTCTNKQLPRLAAPDVVAASEDYVIPDLHPISPLIDLKLEHIWRDENVTGFREGFTHAHPHTLYITHRKRWNTSQRQAQALMYTFAHALAHAKELYGPEPQVLPEPLVMNCVHTDNANFDFLSFQLNTTDFSSAGGIKNLVWFDAKNELYKRIEPNRAMLRNTEYHDYDPDVFEKLVALHLHGLDLSYTWDDLEQKLEQEKLERQEAVSNT